jgi:hypothetical protein
MSFGSRYNSEKRAPCSFPPLQLKRLDRVFSFKGVTGEPEPNRDWDVRNDPERDWGTIAEFAGIFPGIRTGSRKGVGAHRW